MQLFFYYSPLLSLLTSYLFLITQKISLKILFFFLLGTLSFFHVKNTLLFLFFFILYSIIPEKFFALLSIFYTSYVLSRYSKTLIHFIENLFHKLFHKNSSSFLVLYSYVFLIFFSSCCFYFFSLTKIDLSLLETVFISSSLVTNTCFLPYEFHTLFNQHGIVFVLCILQLGGLGILSLSSFLLVILGKSFSLKENLFFSANFNINKKDSIKNLLVPLFSYVFILEFLGFLFLSPYFYFIEKKTFFYSLFLALFHSVSAFCQSGLVLIHQNHPYFLTIIGCLIFLSSLGFFIIYDFYLLVRKKKLFLSLQSKISLMMTFFFIVIPTLLFFILEFHHALKEYSLLQKIGYSLFHTISSRTSGFTIFPLNHLSYLSLFLTGLIMFIGGASGSTTGGIKLSTFFVLLLSIKAFFKENHIVTVFQRILPLKVFFKAITLFFITASFLVFSFSCLLFLENESHFFNIFFEMISVFSTTGFSLGLVNELQTFSKILFICLMIFGKIGILAFVFIFQSKKHKSNQIFHPEEEIMIG
jgi:trk system potassium uptake protein TrkH